MDQDWTKHSASERQFVQNVQQTFMTRVYGYVALGLALSGVFAWVFASNTALLDMLYQVDQINGGMRMTGLGWFVMFAPLGIVFISSFSFEKLSVNAMFGMFAAYSILLGMSLSFIFLAYDLGAIAKSFFITAVTFGSMAALGLTTKKDLSTFGQILYTLLIGCIIAIVVNWFIGSTGLSMIIDLILVVVFTGLIAWKSQMLKELSTQIGTDSKEARKLIIWGAWSLYISFVNLFLIILRYVGNRD